MDPPHLQVRNIQVEELAMGLVWFCGTIAKCGKKSWFAEINMKEVNMKSITCQRLTGKTLQHQILKRTINSTILLFLFFFSACGQAWSGDDFFFLDINSGQPKTALPSSDIVKRIRPVLTDLAKLTGIDRGELVCNCFDDVIVTVNLVKQDRTIGGQTLWLGTIKGVAHSYVMLVSNNKTVSGEISSAAFHYQIRPWQEGFHIVREMVKKQSSSMVGKLSGSVSFEDEVVVLTNQERVANSLHVLSQDAKLTISARGHAADMAVNDYFDHTGLDGSSPFDRITDAGYVWNSAGENIAAGYSTPTEVVNGWMNSPGHRANILNSTFCDIGVGYAFEASSTYYSYWVQNFGRKLGVSVCPTASTPPQVPDSSDLFFPIGAFELLLLDNSK